MPNSTWKDKWLQMVEDKAYGETADTLNQAYGRANQMIQPYQNYGVETLADLRKFTSGDPTQAVLSDPTYNFGYNQGMTALNNAAGSRNRLLSGRALKEMTQFGQDYGMSKYDQILGKKLGLAGFGFRSGAQQGVDLATGQGNAMAGLQQQQYQSMADREAKRSQERRDRNAEIANFGGNIMGWL